MFLILEIINILLWLILVKCFTFVRFIYWTMNGTYHHIQKTYNETSYTGTVQVLRIRMRYKFDVISQPSSENNFIATHHSFENPEYLLSDNVSLYSVTKTKAIFIEVNGDINVSNSDFGVFFRQAQFAHAWKIIIVPMRVFHKMADRIGAPEGKLIFVSQTSRCGSTLLTQVRSL